MTFPESATDCICLFLFLFFYLLFICLFIFHMSVWRFAGCLDQLFFTFPNGVSLHPDKQSIQKTIFIIFVPKYIMWVLIGIASVRPFQCVKQDKFWCKSNQKCFNHHQCISTCLVVELSVSFSNDMQIIGFSGSLWNNLSLVVNTCMPPDLISSLIIARCHRLFTKSLRQFLFRLLGIMLRNYILKTITDCWS